MIKPPQTRFFIQSFVILFLMLFGSASFCEDMGIKLSISRNDLLNPGTKEELFLGVESHLPKKILCSDFPNGSSVVYYLVDSAGNPVPAPGLSLTKTYRRRQFFIFPGKCNGVIVNLNKFRISAPGDFFISFAMLNPFGDGLLISGASKITLESRTSIESIQTVPSEILPKPVRETLRSKYQSVMVDLKIPLNSTRLPF